LKQVVVVNEALSLPRGKLAAQVAHAAVEGFINASNEVQRIWLEEGMPKVVLQGGSEFSSSARPSRSGSIDSREP
jgi:peptidyl-tRNA hydrolase, PTH2 family